MTPQERQLVDELFERLSKMESAQRDPDAAAAIAQGLRGAPNAIYALVQTVLVQDEALRRAHHRIEELEGQSAAPNQGGGGFLDTMRGAILGPGQSGQGQSRSSVPNVPPPDAGQRPVWNSGQVLQQSSAGRYDQGAYGQPQGGYAQSYGGPQFPPQAPMGGPMGGMGGGGSFLGTAAAAAAGVVGGSLLLNSIRSMMGGSHYGLADAGGLTDRNTDRSPWSNQSDSTLARDAGINDVGSSSGHADDSRAGFFDTASNDDDRDDMNDDTDMDADDFDAGGNGDSDFA